MTTLSAPPITVRVSNNGAVLVAMKTAETADKVNVSILVAACSLRDL